MIPKFIACHFIITPEGAVRRSNEHLFDTFENAQQAGEILLPMLTEKLAPNQVIWMVREIAA